MSHETYINGISNHYGGLKVKIENEKYYWSITNYDGDCWDEIPQYLYDALLKYENEP